jgi:hypothetical protein
MQAPQNSTRKRRSSASSSSYGVNPELEQFLNLNAQEAYKRPWHRLERGLRLNRIRNFVEAEKKRLNLTDTDTEYLKAKIEKALEKKLLNSKTCVVYDQEKEEIQEIKGLVYHKTADGKMLSNILEKKMTFRVKSKNMKVEEAENAGQTNE